jgi:hypothetical protein
MNETTGHPGHNPDAGLLIIPPGKLFLKQSFTDESGGLFRRLPKKALYCQYFM